MIFKTITKLLHNKRILQAITERKKEKKEIFLLERKMVKLVELDFAFNLKSLFLRYDPRLKKHDLLGATGTDSRGFNVQHPITCKS